MVWKDSVVGSVILLIMVSLNYGVENLMCNTLDYIIYALQMRYKCRSAGAHYHFFADR